MNYNSRSRCQFRRCRCRWATEAEWTARVKNKQLGAGELLRHGWKGRWPNTRKGGDGKLAGRTVGNEQAHLAEGDDDDEPALLLAQVVDDDEQPALPNLISAQAHCPRRESWL